MATQNAATYAASLGFAQAFFNSDPELKALINRAVSSQMDVVAFQAAFMNTKWYRNRQASVRQWFDLTTRDPMEAQKKILDQTNVLNDDLSQLGVKLSASQVNSLATQALQYGWTDAELKNVLAQYVGTSNFSGTPLTIEDQYRKLAGDYGVNVDDNTLGSWVQGTLNSSLTQDNVTGYLQNMAMSKYPGMTPYLQQGMTVRQVAQPYLQSYGNILEQNPETVNLNDPLIAKALQGTQTDPTKPPVMQGIWQFEQALKQDPRWLQTQNAHNDLKNAADQVGRAWGLIS